MDQERTEEIRQQIRDGDQERGDELREKLRERANMLQRLDTKLEELEIKETEQALAQLKG